MSYSTSHAETLSAIGGLETVSLVAVRLSELYFKGKPSLKDQEFGNDVLPVDCMTDCRDFFELTAGERTLPQDKGQRLYVLAHKEARINGRIRWMVLVPTQSMVADALTKPMLAPQLLHLTTTGAVHYYNEENHPMLLRRLPPLHEYDEDTILKTDDELVNMFLAVVAASATRVSKPFLVAAIMASQSTLVGASTSSSTTSTPSTTSSWLDYDFVIFWLLTVFIVLIIERAVIHGGLYLQSLMQSLSTAWTSSSSSTATSGTTSTSSTGVQTEQVFVHNLVQERKYKNLLQELEAANRQLEIYRGGIATSAEQDVRRRLRATEYQVADLKARIREHFGNCPAGKSLFCATYSRCWHMAGTCSQFKKESNIKACSQCSYSSPLENKFPGLFSDSSGQ